MLSPRVLGTFLLMGHSAVAFADRFGIEESTNEGPATGSWWATGIVVVLYVYLYFTKR